MACLKLVILALTAMATMPSIYEQAIEDSRAAIFEVYSKSCERFREDRLLDSPRVIVDLDVQQTDELGQVIGRYTAVSFEAGLTPSPEREDEIVASEGRLQLTELLSDDNNTLTFYARRLD